MAAATARFAQRAEGERRPSRGRSVSAGYVVSRGTVTLEAERCKGCELCIPACPPHVLRMSQTRNANGYAIPELFPGCTGCGACLLVCPDFCFEIYQYETPVTHEVME